MNLIPAVKILNEKEELFKYNFVFSHSQVPAELKGAFSKLPISGEGADLSLNINGTEGEGYEIYLENTGIVINAQSIVGGFYALQTLRQIFTNKNIHCLYIKDYPDFTYRGFYHDATRGKVPTVETIKKLIDKMAYLKLNSLQLYVEHTFEFKECSSLNGEKGFFTAEEIKELDLYCKDNFIEFIPSIATFGHLFELLEQDEFKHLRVLSNYKADENFWNDRMAHHTINPMKGESIDVIKSLIDQYYPLFETEFFNICCDETFDLQSLGGNTGEIYVEFVKKIIAHLKSKGKKIMMWADILLQHPEFIEEIPEDTYFLNWGYAAEPDEENIEKFAALGRKQIVCPGTSSWSHFCEDIKTGTSNISLMAEYGKKHGAEGVLNTNWGDWGNPCSVELANYGLTVGAEKSWSVETVIDDKFDENINALIYNCPQGAECVKALSTLHENMGWNDFVKYYYSLKAGEKPDNFYSEAEILKIQNQYTQLVEDVNNAAWQSDDFKEEITTSAKAICLIAQLCGKKAGYCLDDIVDFDDFINEYSRLWLKKNKKSELCQIINVFNEMKSMVQ